MKITNRDGHQIDVDELLEMTTHMLDSFYRLSPEDQKEAIKHLEHLALQTVKTLEGALIELKKQELK